MKKLTLVVLFIIFATSMLFGGGYDFIHPLDFTGTDEEKLEVVAFIQEYVKETYSAIGMDSPSTLRMMEGEELKSFKKLTKTKNRKLLDDVIETYGSIGMGSYSTIFMMYKEELKASQEELTW